MLLFGRGGSTRHLHQAQFYAWLRQKTVLEFCLVVQHSIVLGTLLLISARYCAWLRQEAGCRIGAGSRVQYCTKH